MKNHTFKRSLNSSICLLFLLGFRKSEEQLSLFYIDFKNSSDGKIKPNQTSLIHAMFGYYKI